MPESTALAHAASSSLASARFELRRELGSGGFGIVFEAFDRERGLPVALKTLRRATPEAEARLKREFRSLVDLAHPNLVAPYDLVASPDGLFFTMELVDGVDFLRWVRPGVGDELASMSTTLASGEELPESGVRDLPPARLTTLGVLDLDRLRHSLAQLIDALAALHAAGIVHRDLKPSNVLVRPDGRVAVLDYGLATLLARETPGIARRFEGTPAYAAPEQAYGRHAGPPADLYAAGTMLFQALTGRLPFEGSSRQVLLDKETLPAPLARTLSPDAPADLAELADTWLRWDPEARRSPLAPDRSRAADIPLLGRERELETLAGAFARSRERSVRVLVQGPSGIGKTTLVQRFCGRLPPGTLALRGRCHPREVVAFNAFDGVIDDLARLTLADGQRATTLLDDPSRQALGRMFPALRGNTAAGVAPETSGGPALAANERNRAMSVLRAFLADLAERTQIVLFLDDVQWMDRDSQDLLDQLSREPSAPRLLTVLVQRDDSSASLPPLHDSVITRLTLGPLPPDATVRLAAHLLGRSDVDVGRLATASAGHPLFVRELVAQSRDRVGGVFETVDDALHERIAALPSHLGEVLAVLALSTASLDESDLAIAVRRDIGAVLRTVDDLRSRGLVRLAHDRATVTYEPAHDRIREIARTRIPREALSALHRRIARALARDQRPTTLPRLALHLAEAGERDEARALAERAAERAADQLAFGQAAALYRLALSVGARDEAHREHLEGRLLTALLHGHRAVEAAERYLLLARDAPPATASRYQLSAARLLLGSGDLHRGVALLSLLLSRSGQPLPRTTAEGLVALTRERLLLALRQRRPARPGPPSPEALAEIDLAESVSEGLGMVDNFRGAIFQTRALRLSLDAGDPARTSRLLAVQAIYDGQGDTDTRRRVLAELPALRTAAEQSGDTLAPRLVDAAEAVLLSFDGVRRGNIEGLAAIEERLERETRGSTFAIGSIRLLRTMNMRFYGDFELLRRSLPAYLVDADERRDRFMATTMRRGSAFLFLAADDPAGARRALAETSWPSADEGFHVQHWLELDALAEIDLYEGEASRTFQRLRARFEAYERSMLRRVQVVRASMLALEGRLALASAVAGNDARASLRRVEHCVRKLNAEQLPFCEMRAAFLLGGVDALRGRRERAVAHLERGLALADREGAWSLAASARLVLSRMILGERGRHLRRWSDELMRRERILSPPAFAAFEIPGC